MGLCQSGAINHGAPSVAISTIPQELSDGSLQQAQCTCVGGGGGGESTQSTVGTIMVHTMSVWLWMDRFLLLHAFSLANGLASAFTHGTTLESHDMMAPSYPALSFPPKDHVRNGTWWWWIEHHVATQKPHGVESVDGC